MLRRARMRASFASETVTGWKQLQRAIPMFLTDWLYRGQSDNWPLANSLERACRESDISRDKFIIIDKQLIRMFRRRYDGPDRQYVLQDSLYSMSLMQHHGAPTRLLDITNSPYVACFVALQSKPQEHGLPVVWCFNRHWFNERIREFTREVFQNTSDAANEKEVEESENRFNRYYKKVPPNRFVGMVNSFLLHPRIKIRQGLFLCQGDLSVTIEDNIKSMKNWSDRDTVRKIFIKITNKEQLNALDVLQKMNVTEESLFPGLDGFCRSLRLRLPYLLSVEEEASKPPPHAKWKG